MNLSVMLSPIQDLHLSKAEAQIDVLSMTLDSRKVAPGAMFVALKGACDDGARYIDQAIKNGAAVVLRHDDEMKVHYQNDVPVISIVYLNRYLSEIASVFYDHPSRKMNIIGITGTNGKTTCSYLYAQLAAPCAVLGTLGYAIVDGGEPQFTSTGLTTPDAITTQEVLAHLAKQGVKKLAMEVSSHALAQFRVLGVEINTAVFTNLTHDHLDYHGTFEHYQASKARLFDFHSVARVVINYDDVFGKVLTHRLTKKQLLLTYSLKNPQTDFYLSEVSYHQAGSRAILHTPFGNVTVDSPLIGEFNWHNILAVVATYVNSSSDLDKVVRQLKTIKPITGRMELVASQPVQVVIDYAHTSDALIKALKAIKKHFLGKLWCVFGCGGGRDKSKRVPMAEAASQYADFAIVTSDNPRDEQPQAIIDDVIKGMSGEYCVEIDRQKAIEYAILQAADNDIVLVAGKGHEQYQLIGDQKIPFSDHQCVNDAIAKRLGVSHGESL